MMTEIHIESITAVSFKERLLNNMESYAEVDQNLVPELPDYVDHERIKRAQRMFRRNYFAMMTAMYYGLLATLAIPSILKILIHTKKSSSAQTAYQRYMRTVFHVLLWYRHDIKVNSEAWKSIMLVRKFHKVASTSAKSANVGVIVQRDMAITQFGFMGFIVLFKEQLGINCTNEEMTDFCHFWRVLGHLFGISDKFNLCCETFDETLERLQIVRKDFLLPSFSNRDEDFEEMTKFAVSGLRVFNPLDFYHPIIFQIKRLIGVKGYEYLSSEIPQDCERSNLKVYDMTLFNRFMTWISIMTRRYLIKFFVFRWMFNYLTLISEFFCRYFPIIAIFRFGPRKAFVKIN